ncbi:MAG: hypothetical protein CMO44_18870, partial [Verrucomicrobiales bacterium]|nr:hypothetical protein [Verrucomicrobiales bacterium]
MYFFLFLLAAVQAVPPIQLKSNEFYIINAGNPVTFNHSVYIFSYEECRFKAGFLDGSILKTVQNANAPYGCYLSTEATPPTIYWNPVETFQDCSTEFGCVVTEASSRDTFFYGTSELKNISDKRQTQTQFPKQLFDKTPTILTTNRESVRQDDCKINCDPAFNEKPYAQINSCQASWTFEPGQIFRPLAGTTWVSVEDSFGDEFNVVTTGVNTDSVSLSECETYATKNSLTWKGENPSDIFGGNNVLPYLPEKCISESPYVYYNTQSIGQGKTCNALQKCVQPPNQRCTDVADCEDKCSDDPNCMGYTQYDFRDDTLDWPSTSVLYDGNECSDDADCKEKCKGDTTCEGYTKYWWPVYGDNAEKESTEVIPAGECTSSLLSRIYPSDHQFSDSATPGYSTWTNFASNVRSTNGITGCQIRDEKCYQFSASGVYSYLWDMPAGMCSGDCYYNGGRGWNVFHAGGDGNVGEASGTFSVTVALAYFYQNSNEPSTTGRCTFNSRNTGIRKRVRWSYGPALDGTSSYFTVSKEKTFNTEIYLYGLKNNGMSELYSRIISNRYVVRHQDQNFKNNVFSLTKTECISAGTSIQNTEWEDYDLSTVRIQSYTDTIAVDVQELSGSITDLNTDKLPYGCLAAPNGKLYWNDGNLEQDSTSNFQQCGIFKIESYTGFPLESTLTTSSTGLTDFILSDNKHYSVTCLQHPLVTCTWQNNGGGKLYEKDLLNFPTTNEDIAYVQSDRRISLLHPIKSNTEDALRYCLDLCDRTDQCFYANIGDDNACEMYRKCESTSASNKALYRKLPFFLNLSSTLSDQVNDYYYDIGVLDNACDISEPRPECYLDYCNRHSDIKRQLCDDTCDSDEELEACKDHWNTTGSLDASRNFDPETECTRSLFIAQTSRDEDCPTFCITTEGCNIAYKTEDACYALPQCIMSSGEAQGHVITKIIRDQHYHELFPYNAFWPCDAMVLENTDIDACVTEARREDRFVFSYNNDTRKCLIYEHYVENAYDELMDHGINASWCYSNNVLQNAITSLGTCSAAVQEEQNEILQVVYGAFETLVDRGFVEVTQTVEVTQAECLSTALIDAIKLQVAEKFSGGWSYGTAGIASVAANIDYMKPGCAYYTNPTYSGGTTYNRVIFNQDPNGVDDATTDSYSICKRNGEYVLLTDPTMKCKTQDTCIDQFTTLTSTATIELSSNLLTYLNVVDALTACFETPDCNYIVKYTAQQQIVLVKEVTVAAHEVSSGAPDLSITETECYAEAARRGITDASAWDWNGWPKGCVKTSNTQFRYNTVGNTACGASGYACIQQTGTSVGTYAKVNKLCDLPPNACIDLETRAITTKTSGYADTSIVEIFDDHTRTSMDCQSAAEELGYDYKGKYRIVTSGAPDFSLSQSDCEAYGLSIDKWGSSGHWSTDPKGCFHQTSDDKVYYNTNSGTAC